MPKRSKKERNKPRVRKASNSIQPKPEKKARVSEDRTFLWNLSEADFGGEWSMGQLTFRMFCENVWSKIHRFNGMDWSEIMGNRQFHFTPVNRIVRDARVRFTSLYQREPDLGDRLFSTRLSSRERIWAIQRGAEGCIIWYDPEHTVYPVDKN